MDHDIVEIFGQRVRALRKKMGLSQEAFAARCGLDRTYIGGGYLGGSTCLVEMCVALIRACVKPHAVDPCGQRYHIRDLAQIVSTDCVPSDYNVGLLQRSQFEWLFFIARHFCDEISDE